MKKIVAAAALVALAACSKPAPEPEVVDTAAAFAETSAPEATPVSLAADGKPSVGVYKVTAADGKVITEEVKADGTYADKDVSGKVLEKGKWNQQSQSVWCWTKDGETSEACSDEKVENGFYTSTNRQTKKTSTVERVS